MSFVEIVGELVFEDVLVHFGAGEAFVDAVHVIICSAHEGFQRVTEDGNISPVYPTSGWTRFR
jgi:hypothetical protein